MSDTLQSEIAALEEQIKTLQDKFNKAIKYGTLTETKDINYQIKTLRVKLQECIDEMDKLKKS